MMMLVSDFSGSRSLHAVERVERLVSGELTPPDQLKVVAFDSLGEVSARLKNTCGHLSVYALLKLGPAGRRRIRNFGKKTEQELERLLCARLPYLLDDGANLQAAIEDVERNGARRQVAKLQQYDILKEAPDRIDKAINAENVALINSRITAAFRSLKIRQLALSLSLDWPSTGDLAEMTVDDYLKLLPKQVFQPRKGGGLGKLRRRAAYLCVSALAEGASELRVDFAESPLRHPAVTSLTSRQKTILDERIISYPGLTLEELAERFGVTRERVRQEENNILKTIRCSSLGPVLKEVSDALAQKLSQRSSCKRYLLKRDVNKFAEAFNETELFAIRTSGASSVSAWLEAHFVRLPSGYFFGSPDEWLSLSKALCEMEPVRKATELGKLASDYGLTKADIEAFLRLQRMGEVVGGFAVAVGDGKALSARAVRWYQEMKKAVKTSHNFADVFRANKLSPREARLVKNAISSSPSLFVTTSSFFCCLRNVSLSHSSDRSASVLDQDKGDTGCSSDESDPAGENGKAEQIFSYVEARWPVEGGVLGHKKCRESGDLADVALGSFQFHLSTDHRIIRISPGLFAPWSFVKSDRYKEKMERAYRLALDEATIRSFLFSRRCRPEGSPLFPLWNERYDAEVVSALCGRREEDILWESCASVCRVNEHMDGLSALRLTARRATAQFRLAPGWLSSRAFSVPSFVSAFTVAGLAIDQGAISWMEANKALAASQITEERGVNCIILLSALGILKPISCWWQPVPVAHNASEIFESLSRVIHDYGDLKWSSPEVSRALCMSAAVIGVKESTLNGIIASCMREEITEARGDGGDA